MTCNIKILPNPVEMSVSAEKYQQVKGDLVCPHVSLLEKKLDDHQKIADILKENEYIILHEKNDTYINFIVEFVSQNIKFVVNIKKESTVLDLKDRLSIKKGDCICIEEGMLDDNVLLTDVHRLTRFLFIASDDTNKAYILKVICAQDRKEYITTVSEDDDLNSVGQFLIEQTHMEEGRKIKLLFAHTPQGSNKPQIVPNSDAACKYSVEKGGRLVASISCL